MAVLERISRSNIWTFKKLRLRALRDSPMAFASTYHQECQLRDLDWLVRADQLDDGRSIGLIAVESDVACGMVRGATDDVDATVGWVESMWVAPTHRKVGVGGQLILAIVEWAHTRNLRMLKLEVTSNNQRAIRLYERLGFSPTGKTAPYPHDSTLTENEMSRDLLV
ncbi:GNAT family N-acetyltransferase [Schlesneria paludicola]|uniref:GNAT family N-acetyltransferase n=1 Tax=Schlesneria paludicola TaxID=360056 RepID=UPI00029A2637|nr:GNAT family N-acetyltransferase [Schlesneria paludicola]